MLGLGCNTFGLRIGFAEIRVLVTRPPDSPIAAQRVAAEHFPFCDECGPGLRSVSEITDYLVDARFWDFWWVGCKRTL